MWLSCEPADNAATHLVGGIAAALDMPPESELERILDHVWADAPSSVCFVFDDVHEIAPASEGAIVLRRLIDDLPGNGHVLLASRDSVPVPIARLAASDQLVRVREADLVFDEAELAAFASSREVEPGVLGSCGGWPALAELAANAGADLVVDYLWEEVLARIGPERSRLLAMLAVAGPADDDVVSSLAGRATSVREAVASVPLVQRAAGGWVELHPLWGPPLRHLLSEGEADVARRRAASVHRQARRLDVAAELLVEAADWTSLLSLMRDAAVDLGPVGGLIRWHRSLPMTIRDDPAALFAKGLEARGRWPADSLAHFAASAAGFRAAGDVEGETTALLHESSARLWAYDRVGLSALFGRIGDLAASGCRRAVALEAVNRAGAAYDHGDADGVLSALAAVEEDLPAEWPVDLWFVSGAHRRNGDLGRATEALDRAAERAPFDDDPQLEMARARIDWLRGEVDHVRRVLASARTYYEPRDRHLLTEAVLELASKVAWLGESTAAAELLATLTPEDAPGGLMGTLQLIAETALAVGAGDEERAAVLLRESSYAAPGRPRSWYWTDRAALALPYVLVPEARDAWAAEVSAIVHQPGLVLARALVMARQGDRAFVGGLVWPAAGVVRVHLPRRWAVELAAAGLAMGNPAPDDLLDAIGPPARADLRAVIDGATSRSARVAVAAEALLDRVPAAPSHRVRVGVLGPLEVWSDGQVVRHPHLRRQRVRELLCLLVSRGRVRREEVADELWPELADPARNLRTTLNYLQKVLEPDREEGEPPYFLRAEGAWLSLTGGDHLEVDVWKLAACLDSAEAAERVGDPAGALECYRAVLPLWRGEPYADAVEGSWLLAERSRLCACYTAAALRAGELLLAAGDSDAARSAGHHALHADPSGEPGHQLVIRTHLADGNLAGATRAVQECRSALADLGLEPHSTTTDLIAAR